MSQLQKLTKLQQANSNLLEKAQRIVFLDIGQLAGRVYSWEKGFSEELLANIVGKLMAGHEMLLSPGKAGASTRPKKDFIAAVLKYFYYSAAVN
ncbi:hypothetical protein [Parasitella parasitica]|uniref:Uncharacterized protein n=1 Tax=Parasitella parasitica TaxID=35722 RepID=A0A0B7MUW8_9FUNG|nr:hypothetical protein [Parasitella parasitica]